MRHIRRCGVCHTFFDIINVSSFQRYLEVHWVIWILILISLLALNVIGAIYILNRIARFAVIKKITKENKRRSRLVGAAIEIVAFLATYFALGLWNVFIVYLHVLFFWLVSDLIGKQINKVWKCERKYYLAGIVAIVLSVSYLSYGYYMAHHVIETDYTFETSKDMGVEGDKLRVVAFADSHLGATFGWEEFDGYIDRMNALNPDIVVISGDYVDDDSDIEDMLKCSEALGRLKTTYGVYFVLGNHDKGYYAGSREFSEADLLEKLEQNNVTVLRDEIVNVVGNVYILGRLDSQVYDRKEMSDYDAELFKDNYVITMDHEPNDYDNEAVAGVDMVVSGHTHGGQLFPFNEAGVWFGMNDKTYGTERRDNTDFIVTSGIGDWALDFKTGCVAEYLVIDIEQK